MLINLHMITLGIDYGSRRIGLAISDELGITARPLGTLERKNIELDLEKLGRIISENHVMRIVIGLPLRLDGTRGVQCEKVERFTGLLESRFQLPVIMWDEALSTWEAEEQLMKAGVKAKKRRGMVDKVAASLILQSFLQRHGAALKTRDSKTYRNETN